MHFNCAVTGCNACSRKIGKLEKYPWMSGIKFYSFPHKTKRPRDRKVWTDLIRRENFSPSRYTKVCSRHFKDGVPTAANPHPTLFPYNNYGKPLRERPLPSVNRSLLTGESTPTGTRTGGGGVIISPPGDRAIGHGRKRTADGLVLNSVSRSLLVIPGERIDIANDIELESEPHPKSRRIEVSLKGQHDILIVPNVLHHEYCLTSAKLKGMEINRNKDAACQTDMMGIDIERSQMEMDILQKKLDNKDQLLADLFYEKSTKDDSKIRKYYGLPNKAVFDGIYSAASPMVKSMKYWSGKHSAQTKEYENTGKQRPGPKRKLDPKHEFALTLMKLRLGLVSFIIGDLFSVSTTRVSQIFITWISFLNQVIATPLLPWPSRVQVNKNMPDCFRKAYPKTRVIIDCSEFYIQCPGKPSTQHSTYSQYKSHNTYKVLFGIDPNGAFTFVSDLWSGNVSDKYITRESGLLEMLEKGDEVMADRGFQIEDLLLPKAKLVAPPFTRKCKYGKQKRLNVAEIRTTRKIANLRIHVERAIQRIKTFRFFTGDLDVKYKGIINQAIRVAAALCNLKPPLVK